MGLIFWSLVLGDVWVRDHFLLVIAPTHETGDHLYGVNKQAAYSRWAWLIRLYELGYGSRVSVIEYFGGGLLGFVVHVHTPLGGHSWGALIAA